MDKINNRRGEVVLTLNMHLAGRVARLALFGGHP